MCSQISWDKGAIEGGSIFSRPWPGLHSGGGELSSGFPRPPDSRCTGHMPSHHNGLAPQTLFLSCSCQSFWPSSETISCVITDKITEASIPSCKKDAD